MSRLQLLGAGLSSRAITRRLADGRLHQLHRGVYAVRHVAIAPHGRDLAAVLAAGAGAALSHRSAAALWGMLPRREGEIDVIRARAGRSRPGIHVHRTTDLPPRDVRLRFGIPVTTPHRTLLDLAATAPGQVERALNEALIHRLIHPPTLLRSAVQRAGAAVLRSLLEDHPGPSRSEAERGFLRLIDRAGLPRPEANVHIGPYEVDALWRSQRLVAEVDGYAYHASRAAFESDRARDAALQARGFTVVRITWRQLTETPEAVVARLAPLLMTEARG